MSSYWAQIQRSRVDRRRVLNAAGSASRGNPYFTGFDVAGKGDFSGDPEIEALVLKARGEFDSEKRRAIIFEVQRLAGARQYILNFPGTANEFLVAWPCVKNAGVYRRGSAPADFYEWIDENEAPLKRA